MADTPPPMTPDIERGGGPDFIRNGGMALTAGRRCALPGCYVVIGAPAGGQPQRKYCTAAHRAIARQQRREGTQRSAAAPPLPGPPAEPLRRQLPLPPLAVQLEANPARRPTGAGRKARTLALLGSAGLLVTGTTLSLTDDSPRDAGPSSANPWQARDLEAEQNWASEARVSLSSVELQLQDVVAAERDWYALPAEERAGEVPGSIRDLARRKVLLEQQRSALAERLAAYDTFARAEQDLAVGERTVAELDRALSSAPVPSQSSPAEADDLRRLREERAARDRVLARQRDEVDALRADLREAMAGPLPSGDQATRAITSAVRELVRDPGRRRSARSPVESGGAPAPGPQDHARRVPGEVLAAPSTPPGGGPDVGPVDDGGDAVLVETIGGSESSVSGRTVTRVANVVYEQAERAESASGAAGGAPAGAGSLLPRASAVAPRSGAPVLPDLRPSPDTRDYDPVTSTRAQLAARSAEDAISGWRVDDDVKNLARAVAGHEIRRQSQAEAGRYRATGGREDSRRIAETLRSVAEVKARAEVSRSIARELRSPSATTRAMVAASLLKQAERSDLERAKRLLSSHAKQRIAASARTEKYRAGRKLESAVRDHLRSSARKSVEKSVRKSFERSMRKSIEKSASRSIEKSISKAARRSASKARSDATRHIVAKLLSR